MLRTTLITLAAAEREDGFDVPQFDHVPAGGTDDDGEAPPVVGGGPLSVGVLPIEVVSI